LSPTARTQEKVGASDVVVVEGDNSDGESDSGPSRKRKRSSSPELNSDRPGDPADRPASLVGHPADVGAEAASAPAASAAGDGASEGPGMALPPGLRRQLLDDWNYVSQERRLVPLPAKKHLAVDDILAAFVSNVGKTAKRDVAVAREVAVGVESAFNAAVGTVLLYPFERLQVGG
jgi:hypothetical protein